MLIHGKNSVTLRKGVSKAAVTDSLKRLGEVKGRKVGAPRFEGSPEIILSNNLEV